MPDFPRKSVTADDIRYSIDSSATKTNGPSMRRRFAESAFIRPIEVLSPRTLRLRYAKTARVVSDRSGLWHHATGTAEPGQGMPIGLVRLFSTARSVK